MFGRAVARPHIVGGGSEKAATGVLVATSGSAVAGTSSCGSPRPGAGATPGRRSRLGDSRLDCRPSRRARGGSPHQLGPQRDQAPHTCRPTLSTTGASGRALSKGDRRAGSPGAEVVVTPRNHLAVQEFPSHQQRQEIRQELRKVLGAHYLQVSLEVIDKLVAWRLSWMSEFVANVTQPFESVSTLSTSLETYKGASLLPQESLQECAGEEERRLELFRPHEAPSEHTVPSGHTVGSVDLQPLQAPADVSRFSGDVSVDDLQPFNTSIESMVAELQPHQVPSETPSQSTAREMASDVPGFDLNLRSVSGDVILMLSGAHVQLTRMDIVQQLMEEVPPPLGHAYKLIYQQAVFMGNQTTLGDCLGGTSPSGPIELTVVSMANEAHPVLLQATDAVLQQARRDIAEASSYTKPPMLVDLTFKVLCDLWAIQPVKVRLTDGSFSDGYWQVARQALLHNKGAGLMECIHEYDPDHDPRHAFDILDPYISGDSFVPARVAACSRFCKVLCEWCWALHAYCRFSLEHGLA